MVRTDGTRLRRKETDFMAKTKTDHGPGQRPMKLAEALLVRADQKKKLASLRERLVLNGRVQEGDQPHEDPEELLREAASVLQQQEDLLLRIDRANASTLLADGRSVLQALGRRDSLGTQHSLLSSLLERAKQETERYSSSEIKWRTTFSVKAIQKRLEDVARQMREINGHIQEANWKAEV